MKKIIYTFLFVSCFYALPSCAQSKIPIVKAYAYYMIPIPGTIAVDDNGQPLKRKRDTVFNIYVETKSNGISWERAWLNGRVFSIIPFPAKSTKVEVGEDRPESRRIVLTPQTGNTIIQLELSNDQKHEKAPQKLLNGEILVKGKWKNQVFYYKIKSMTELASPMYQ